MIDKTLHSWISIRDQKVLAYRPLARPWGDEKITILKFTGVNSIDLNGIQHQFERSHYVTHWIPLPSEPI